MPSPSPYPPSKQKSMFKDRTVTQRRFNKMHSNETTPAMYEETDSDRQHQYPEMEKISLKLLAAGVAP